MARTDVPNRSIHSVRDVQDRCNGKATVGPIIGELQIVRSFLPHAGVDEMASTYCKVQHARNEMRENTSTASNRKMRCVGGHRKTRHGLAQMDGGGGLNPNTYTRILDRSR
jgi:hypothetical protein